MTFVAQRTSLVRGDDIQRIDIPPRGGVDLWFRPCHLGQKKALVQNRRYAVALRALSVALVKVGQHDRAEQVVKEILAIEPEMSISGFLRRISVPVESLAKVYTEALRTAGWPD